MSNLFKSKFVLGLMLVAAFAFTTTASAAITSTLKLGSNNSQVKELQQGLNSSGFVVSTSGAGSVGSETNYFGSKTKTAVKSWQASKGLTADGVFGPASRAAWTGTTGGTYPAGCSSSTGFSTTTGLPCSGGSSTTYPAGCSSSVGFSSTTGLPCTGTTSQTGPVTASLAANNPASTTLVAGQATANLAHFTFSGAGTVTAVTLQRIGVSSDTTPSNVYLFDGATRLTDAASVSNNGSVTFNVPAGIFTVNGTKTISVRSDIATGTSGQTVGMMLATFTTSAGTTTANLSGNIHSIASATLASVSAGVVTPSNSTLNPGAGVTVWQSTLNISQRDVWMKRIAVRNVGSAPAASFANFKLYVGGVQVATATGLDINGYVTFDMTNTPVKLISGSRVVRIDADIVSGASRTVHFSLRNAADVDFVDSSFGVNVAPTSTPWEATTASTISGVGGGSLTIEKDTTSPSSNLTLSGNDVKLATYKVTAYGEPIKIENIRATFQASDAAVDSLRNGRIVIGGVQYGSTSTLMEDSSTPAYTQYTLNYTVNPGTPVLMDLHADMFDNDGTNDLTAADTLIGVIAVGASNAQKVDSLGSINAPAVLVTGNTLTVASATVGVTANGTYGNQSVSVPATAFKIGAWNLAGSSVEDVDITTLSFDVDEVTGATFSEADLTNMYVVVKNGATIVSQPAPLATVSAADNNFQATYKLAKNSNITVELYANLGSTVTTTHSFRTDLSVTGTASVSGTAVAVNDVIGQTIIAGTATITATQDASSPVTSIVYDNQTVTAAAFKFAAVTAGFDVTDLTFTLASNAVVSSVELYDGATLVASKPGNSTVTFNDLNWNIPANTNKVLTVKLVVGTVLDSGSGTTAGSNITVTLTDFSATNISTGGSDDSANDTGPAIENNPAGTAMYAYASTPTITNLSLDGTNLGVGTTEISKFSVASNGGTIGWKKIIFTVTRAIGGTDTLSNTTLYDADTNTAIAGAVTYSGSIEADGGTSGTIIFIATNEQQVAGTKNYSLKTDLAGTFANGNNITVKINQPSGYVAPAAYATVAGTTSSFTWTDTSASNHSETTLDWNNGLLVKNLPTNTQTRTTSGL
jgi:peptidoglycan hydrolase-like protein with peptidoglycan-binding domain